MAERALIHNQPSAGNSSNACAPTVFLFIQNLRSQSVGNFVAAVGNYRRLNGAITGFAHRLDIFAKAFDSVAGRQQQRCRNEDCRSNFTHEKSPVWLVRFHEPAKLNKA
jgi:hypothetical protein